MATINKKKLQIELNFITCKENVLQRDDKEIQRNYSNGERII